MGVKKRHRDGHFPPRKSSRRRAWPAGIDEKIEEDLIHLSAVHLHDVDPRRNFQDVTSFFVRPNMVALSR